MDNLIATFHLNLSLLIAQVINFAIVLAVLYWFAFKPLTKMMNERAEKISQGLADAKRVEEKLAQTEKDYGRQLAEAKKQANVILEKAARDTEAKKAEMVVRAKEEIGAIINQEKQKMQAEKAKTLHEIKAEVADLVVAAVEKVLSKKLDKKEDMEMIRKIVK
ncbi:MAG: F0F1 ATP synthase subunit B [Patescibacteria group bacterium]|nr:F0F1 ATP synthase subunit B [Patescibacteria group bacterium]